MYKKAPKRVTQKHPQTSFEIEISRNHSYEALPYLFQIISIKHLALEYVMFIAINLLNPIIAINQ